MNVVFVLSRELHICPLIHVRVKVKKKTHNIQWISHSHNASHPVNKNYTEIQNSALLCAFVAYTHLFIPNNVMMYSYSFNSFRIHRKEDFSKSPPSVERVCELQGGRACTCDVLSHGWFVLMRCNLSLNGSQASGLQAIHAAVISVPFSTGHFPCTQFRVMWTTCASRSVWECTDWPHVHALQ